MLMCVLRMGKASGTTRTHIWGSRVAKTTFRNYNLKIDEDFR